jgi:uncharacterized oxidoreductase
MPLLTADRLTDLVRRIFAAAGTPDDIAEITAKSLVLSDLVGHESHGVVRVRQYLDALRRGDLDPAARPMIVHETGAAFTVDACRGFGQLAARWTMEQAIARAKEYGVSAAGLINCGHVGRLGEWVELAASENALALGFCNGGGVSGAVTPYGGAERVLGTNPIAAAIPVDGPPIVLDFATSVVAEGKVRVARNRGKTIPEGWILDANGLPTTNPHDLYNGGVLLPAAGHKGYGLSLLVEYLGGVLTGNGTPALPGYRAGNGVLFIVLDGSAFRPWEDYLGTANDLAARVKRTRTAPGFDEVLLPGAIEQRNEAARRSLGVQVDDATWKLLMEDAAAYAVAVDA